MTFKMYNMDWSFTYQGVEYDFLHVQSASFENPESVKIIRGANQGNKTGVVFVEGGKEPKTGTLVILDMSKSQHELLTKIFLEKARIDVNGVDRTDGSSCMAKQAILSQQPLQLSMDDSPESMDMALVFQTFDLTQVKKT